MPSVNKDTADKVWESLNQLGYIPHASARTAARSRLLGLVIAPLSEPHSAELTARFHESAALLGFDVLTCSIGDCPSEAAHQLQSLFDRKIEGIAILALNTSPELNQALSLADVPVVCCEPAHTTQNTTTFSIDYGRGVREGVQHLALLGHREIAFLGSSPVCPASRQKSEAFLLALKEIGCIPNSDWLIESEASFTGGIAGMERLLAFSHRPSAVLCSCDAVALGALWALRHAGIFVPEGMSLICLDDCQFAEWMAPPVTTVQISLRVFARTAIDTLQAMIENPSVSGGGSGFKVPTTLIVRGSTSYPPGRALPRTTPESAILEHNPAL